MELEAEVYKECSHCETPIAVPLPSDENSQAPEFWSDGFVETHSEAQNTVLAHCGKCNEVVWLHDLPSVFIGEDNHLLQAQVTFFVPIEDFEAFDLLKTDFFQQQNEQVQLFLRQHAWQLGNHKRRDTEDVAPLSLSEKKNINALLATMPTDEPQSLLLKAELHRALGQFEQSIALLSDHFEPPLDDIAAKLKGLASQKHTELTKLVI